MAAGSGRWQQAGDAAGGLGDGVPDSIETITLDHLRGPANSYFAGPRPIVAPSSAVARCLSMSDSTAPHPFTLVRLREGYSIADVDTFLAEVTRALRGRLPDPALAQRIQNARFNPVRLRAGYDMGEVDQYLDELHTFALQGHPQA